MMDTIVFILLTDDRNDLDNVTQEIKNNSKLSSLEIAIFEMEHLSGKSIDDINLKRIKNIIDDHRDRNPNTIIIVIGDDDEQFVSLLNSVAGKYTPSIIYSQNGSSVPLI